MIFNALTKEALERVEAAKRALSAAEIKRLALQRLAPKAFPFTRALEKPGLSLICEVKKGSPSKGVIARQFDPASVAKAYAEGGADAISVLTEPRYFFGQDSYLRDIRGVVGVPLLRKDFFVDAYQIFEARLLGADAVLLICACIEDDGRLLEFYQTARALGLSSLIECHDEAEVERALKTGARLIGVNNRDLKTFSVSLATTARLAPYIPKDRVFVSESGYHTPADVRLAREAGADAVLIGESLMRAPDKAARIAAFKREAGDDGED